MLVALLLQVTFYVNLQQHRVW